VLLSLPLGVKVYLFVFAMYVFTKPTAFSLCVTVMLQEMVE